MSLIFTRVGADTHSQAMIDGAMREHDYLILVLDNANIKKMIGKKASGSEPADCLAEPADDFLLTPSR